MTIIPISSNTPINAIKESENTPAKSIGGGGFADIFKDAIKNVEETRKVCEEDSIKVALGEIDDLHSVMANSQKAALALETFVSLKNTAVDAYNEVLRMSI